jgi:acetyl esterase/lipase
VKRTLEHLGSPEPSIEELEIDIPVRDGWFSKARVCRPSSSAAAAPGPLVVLYHGGGFMVGAPGALAGHARGLVRLFGAVVVAPSYRLAPEDLFPAGPLDAWDTLKWAAENAASLGADPSKGFVVGGASAGGNFAGLLARQSVEQRLQPPLTGHWAAVPVFFDGKGAAVPEKYKNSWISWQQNKDAMLINSTTAETLLRGYGYDFNSPLYNPMAPGLDAAKMPKAFVQVAGMDIVRDDGIVYSYVLNDGGVPVRLKAYAGVPHTFWAFVPTLEVSRTAIVDIAEGVGWLLGLDVDREKATEAMLTKNGS